MNFKRSAALQTRSGLRHLAVLPALLLIATTALGENKITTTEDAPAIGRCARTTACRFRPRFSTSPTSAGGSTETSQIRSSTPTSTPSSGRSMPGDDGFCLSLPRKSGQHGRDPGLICMADTGETCFFTNPEGETFSSPPPNPKDQIQIEELIGGIELVDNPEGVCADCHIGENPFNIHPEDPMFQAAKQELGSLFPSSWPTPIIPDHADWPENPLPIEWLGPTEGPGCDTCHVGSGQAGGRLPLVSTRYPRYCSEVLNTAIGESPGHPAPATMPPSTFAHADANHDHRTWLMAACESRPGDGTVVPFNPATRDHGATTGGRDSLRLHQLGSRHQRLARRHPVLVHRWWVRRERDHA